VAEHISVAIDGIKIQLKFYCCRLTFKNRRIADTDKLAHLAAALTLARIGAHTCAVALVFVLCLQSHRNNNKNSGVKDRKKE